MSHWIQKGQKLFREKIFAILEHSVLLKKLIKAENGAS